MKKFALVTGLVVFVAAGAWAADIAIDRAAAFPSIPEAPGYDSTVELKWDIGIGNWWLVWITASGIYVGVDFDISTIKTYSGVKTFRIALRNDWPNQGWDGGRIALFSAQGGVPGSIIWPTSGTPKYVLPTGASGWQEFDVSWVLPGAKRFLAAWEQFYNYPNCDPFNLDNNTTFTGHSWRYVGGAWEPMTSSIDPYRNITIRVVVDNEQNPAVMPASVGRVKALYY
jgi:hypothetical protein